MGKIRFIFILFVLKSSLLNHIWSKFTIGGLPNTRIQYLFGNIKYNHQQNAKKKITSLFWAGLYFQLIQYNKYLLLISSQK